MKKINALIVGLSFALPLAASAATFVVTPSSGSYNTGDTVTLNISVNPSGGTIYTAMMDTRFSSDTFEVVSFALNDALLPLRTNGYDALDNTNGVLTKTGGYTGGLTSTASFGTLVFRAKKSGAGTFTIADSSKLFDGNNADQQSGAQTTTYAITAKSIPQTVTAPVQTTPSLQPKTTKTKPETTKPDESTATITSEDASSTQVAAVAESGIGFAIDWTLAFLLSLAMFLAGFLLGRKTNFAEEHIPKK